MESLDSEHTKINSGYTRNWDLLQSSSLYDFKNDIMKQTAVAYTSSWSDYLSRVFAGWKGLSSERGGE